jgi:hypothetical protein
MGTRTKHTPGWLLPFALALAVAACDDSKTEEAPPGDSGSSFTDEDAEVVQADGGGEDLDAGAGSDAAVTTDGAVDTDATVSCTGKDGCYSCQPSKNEEFLNSCAEGCRKFDVKAYPTGWKPGQALPDL